MVKAQNNKDVPDSVLVHVRPEIQLERSARQGTRLKVAAPGVVSSVHALARFLQLQSENVCDVTAGSNVRPHHHREFLVFDLIWFVGFRRWTWTFQAKKIRKDHACFFRQIGKKKLE